MEKYIEEATAHFKKLLCEQIERAKKMENSAKRKDFSWQKKITIGICYGDGIGPIICKEAEALIKVLLKGELENGKIELKAIEGLTIENREKCGQAIPDDVLAEIKKCDVLLFIAVVWLTNSCFCDRIILYRCLFRRLICLHCFSYCPF